MSVDQVDASAYSAIRDGIAISGPSTGHVVIIDGRGAREAVDAVFARDLAYMPRGRARMSLVLDKGAAPTDICLVTRPPTGTSFVVRTDAPASTTASSVQSQAKAMDDVTTEVSNHAVLFLDGPAVPALLRELFGPAVSSMKYLAVTHTEFGGGGDILIVRSGRTGEWGAEVIGRPDDLQCLAVAAAELGAVPATEPSIATAMLEVRQPRLVDGGTSGLTVPELGWTWLTTPRKGPFVGRDALLDDLASPRFLSVLAVGDNRLEPGTSVDTPWAKRVGTVIAERHSPGLGAWLHLVAVDAQHAVIGADYSDRTGATVVSVSNPAVVPTSWSNVASGG